MRKSTILSSSAANATTVSTRASDPASHFKGKDITDDAAARDSDDAGDEAKAFSGDNEDKYRLTSAPAPPARKISERKRIDAATFETWLQKEENSKTVKKQRMEVRERAGRGPKVDKVALVDQQWSALVANLPYPVARLFGRELEGKWTAQFWRKTFEENKINLLIIDEAHHAKKNHPYARIVIDYYLREKDLQDRPRILGMTASPVDGKADILASAKHLESLLQSKIATVSSGRLGDEMGIKVHEEVVQEYKKLEKRYDTRLSQSLKPLIKWNPMFQKHAAFSTLCTYDLGPWCTDRFWKRCFGDGEMGQLLAKAEAVAQQTYGQIPFLPEGKDAVGVIHELREIVRDSPLPPLKKTALDLSYKVLRLLTTLEDYFAKPSDHKCIIFTERRRTAVMLADVCEQLRDLFPALQVGFLVGAGADLNLAGMTYHEAVCTIHKFKTGEINCLFASSIAEEGIDIPDCDIIIRFDLCNSMIQYIQSRGRARHQESKFINMVEESNHAHLVKLKQISRDTRILRDFCSKLPESRRLDMGPDRTANWKSDSGFESFTVEETGATLTFTQSLVVLDSFAASFQEPGGPIITPQYAVMKNGNVWVAQVNLPENLPIQYKRGREQNSKQAAKCSAAFEMCLDLIKRQFIDGHLQPYMKKRLPAMRNARLAVSANKTAQYNMRLKPSLWDKLGRPKRLYGVALTLETPAAVGRGSCPLILLSRWKLPDLPDVPLFFGAGKKSVAQMIPLKGSYGLSKPHSDRDLEELVNFTLRIFKDVFNKAFDATAKEMPYLLAPSRFSHASVYYLEPHIRDTINWG
ncbi:unnamed protein product [Parascedosporium putredinis]|uniref:P-loop containing nucleoside triphosphate hydrolase protein n=1 Tax=Parascedosporium putredinis TaxID=1442378 RepID=A0A9P1GZ91_9PEZI|nr:unnamed protein product [Parascedosporium putredinis]CAI7990620.1 unnamed protein product [Parascedosporium putredinis]